MNNAIPIFLLIYLFNNSQTSSNSGLHTVKEYIKDIQIDKEYSLEKIRLAKKICPLLPSQHTEKVTKSIQLCEKIIRLVEVNDILKTDMSFQVKPLDLDPKERAQKIVATIQTEVDNTNIDNLGLVLDLVVNMDKYKKMFSTFSSLMSTDKSNTTVSSKNKVNSLMNALMENSSEEEKEKMKSMTKIFDLMNNIDLAETNKPNEN